MSVCEIGAKRSRKSLLLMNSGILALWAAGALAPVMAQDNAKKVEFDIQADTLEDALKSYSLATDRQVMFSTDIVERKSAKPVSGQMTADEALVKLLDGSGLVYEATPSSNVILVRVPQQQAMLVEQPSRLAQAQPEDVRERRPGGERDEADGDEPKRDEITVTGTLIKGLVPDSSPVQVYTRDDILDSAASSTEDFLRRAVLENFGGGSTEFTSSGIPNDGNSQRNNTYGTGANLRGLGSGATLTLLNGKRLAPASAIGDFVDLSMIPIAAVERIDVLSDGASSIYGGDAVAGVVNFILRKDFDGAETSVRYGTVTEGDMNEFRASQALGRSWDTGHILATYEFFDRDNLTLADRPDIPPPVLYNGQPIIETTDYDLLPSQKRHSALVSASQMLGSAVELSGSALYSHRAARGSDVAAANVSGVSFARPKSESVAISLGADYDFHSSWTLALEGTFSRIDSDTFAQVISPQIQAPSETFTTSRLWSGSALISGDLIGLPGGQVKLAAGSEFRQENFDFATEGNLITRAADRDILAAFGELYIPIIGDEIAFPGFQRIAVNVSARLDDYSDFGTTVNPKVGIIWSPLEGLNLRGSYGTSFSPPALGRVGARDRGASVASYSWLRGLLNIPSPDPSLDDVDILLLAGTSANLGPEEARTLTGGFDYGFQEGRHTWNLSVNYYDIHFEGRLNTTPVPGNQNPNLAPGLAFDNPDIFPPGTIVFFPSDDEVQNAIADLSRPVTYLGGATDFDNIGILTRVLLTRNLSNTITRGIDLRFEYAVAREFGKLSAGIGANYVFDYIQQAAETTPEVETLDSLYFPVSLRLRGKMGISSGSLAANLFVNYTDGYQTDQTAGAIKIDSWTTVDAALSYDLGKNRDGILAGTLINFSATNVFDSDPPLVPPNPSYSLPGYDPTNASPLGRFIAVELRKSF